LVGIEIKSDKDRLDDKGAERLKRQIRTFAAHLPEFWLAIGPQWLERDNESTYRLRWSAPNCMVVDLGAPVQVQTRWGKRGTEHRYITAETLEILWRNELLRICVRNRLYQGNKGRMDLFRSLIARKLTGDQIIEEVCRELRARDAQWKADPPIHVSARIPTSQGAML
jgi:hypothetical protein